jgi:16S rRNA processing protein RimM
MSEQTNSIEIGKFGAVYGIKGWIKIHSYTENAESLFQYKPLSMQSKGLFQEVNIAKWKYHNNGYVAKIEGYDVREDVQALVGISLFVDETLLPELKDDFYWRDLIGCQVQTNNGYDLGKVSDMMETASKDVLVIKANSNDAFGKKERLIPFITEQVILNVNITKKLIAVNWQPDF